MSADRYLSDEFNHVTVCVPISAEEYRMRTEGPTEAEQERWRREGEARDAEALARRERYEARREAATGFERKVLDLHAPAANSGGWCLCHGCDWGDYAQDAPEWPCATAELALNDEKVPPPPSATGMA